MRKFKLLKDMPGPYKAGSIIDGYVDHFLINPIEDPEWFEEIKEEPKKKVRRWLWDFKSSCGWVLLNEWLTEDEVKLKLKQFSSEKKFKKTTFNGQEVWQDFEE